MVTLASAQAIINRGYGKLGLKLGEVVEWYTPSSSSNPISPVNDNGVMTVRFDPKNNFSTMNTNLWPKPEFFAAYDATLVQLGDYFVQANNGVTYFVCAQDDLVAPMVCRCNDIISFYRPAAQTDPTQSNYMGYSGSTINAGEGIAIAANWPASVLQGTKGQAAELKLPDENRTPWIQIKLPAIPGVIPQAFDRFQDSQGHDFIISDVELTLMGLRLTAQYTEP